MRSCRTVPRHKLGYDVSRSNEFQHAVQISKKNEKTEISQQHEHGAHQNLDLKPNHLKNVRRLNVNSTSVQSVIVGIRLD